MGNALLSINFATVFNVQNTPDLIGSTAGGIQKDDVTVAPINIAKYALYDRTRSSTNFGWNDLNHLSYGGGFITCGDRVNSKYGDFILTGNLTIQNTSLFKRGIDISNDKGQVTNRVTNLKTITQSNFYSTSFDQDIIRVEDFRKITKYKGMITMWVGSYDALVKELPLWRLCAPPDSDINGKNINGVFVPNLQSKFVLGGTYKSFGTFQPKDNLNRNFSTPFSIDSTEEGVNSLKLTANQLPDHRHDNKVVLSGSTSTIFGVNTPENTIAAASFYQNGGGLSVSSTTTHSARTGHIPRQAEHSGQSTFNTVKNVTRNTYTKGKISLSPPPVPSVITRVSHEDRGGKSGYANFDCDPHENRPRFYALAYIVYVDTPR